MPKVDVTPAAEEVARVVQALRDDQLGDPTPCPEYSVAALLDHFMALTQAFTLAARKDTDQRSLAAESPAGQATADHLDPEWRAKLPGRLTTLAQAWDEDAAWEGRTHAGIPMPAEIAGVVGLDEVVLHGWDLARATGQSYRVDPTHIAALRSFVESTLQPGQEQMRAAIFGPVVAVPSTAPAFDQVLGLAGREPGWSAPGSAAESDRA